MLEFNLKKLTDEGGYSLTDIYKKTGISRSTLTQMYYGKSKGIQLDTLEKLTGFFQKPVCDFITDDNQEIRELDINKHDFSLAERVIINKTIEGIIEARVIK